MILFFSTVCYSFKGFKCVTQKLEDPKNSWKFVRPKKIAEILRNFYLKYYHHNGNTKQKHEKYHKIKELSEK